MNKHQEHHKEILAALMSAHPGSKVDITVALLTESGVVVFVVALKSALDIDGVVVGKGLTRTAALLDAQTCLQSALDAVDVAVAKGQR